MSTIDDAIRAGCRAGCLWAVCDYPDCQPGACETYLEHTEVAIKAALAVLLPAEPTEEMVEAMGWAINGARWKEARDGCGNNVDRIYARAAYRALRAHLGLAP